MKVPLSWLKDYVNITLPPAELARRITLAGFEVAEIITSGGDWENVIVGRVVGVSPHPNADRLRLATVDLGTGQETVVCGAPNLKTGDKVAFASPGARLINPYTGQVEELKPAKIRGVLSRGMICSEKELGISDRHEGILVLPPEAEVGRPLAECLGDYVLDIDVTPNRPDCLAIIGIAREVAALCGQAVHVPEAVYMESGGAIDEKISVAIAAPELCPRYCASLITGVKIAESPAWLKNRLTACGQRPINNIVDVTNYVMLEYGQPLHSFDFDRLRGGRIIVRRAAPAESFFTLDNVERQLTEDMLVIADDEGTVAIAGVMGGQNSEVTAGTTSILLEAASFKAASIHYTSRRLGLTSEASMRFERGISPGLTIPALKQATKLIAELGGGSVARGIIDVYPGKKEMAPIVLTAGKVRRVLGIGFNQKEITASLESLGFTCCEEGERVQVTAPYWRSDIRQDVDLIEEIARIAGYEKIPSTLLAEPIPPQDPDPALGLKRKIRQGLVGLGFQEIMTYTLTSLEMLGNLTSPPGPPLPGPVRVANPMTADQEYLRTSLRAGLFTALAANRRHEDGSLKLFEMGKVYLAQPAGLPNEPEFLCGLISGPRVPRSWLGADSTLDFYDVKGILESLFELLHIDPLFKKSQDASLHPVRQAAIIAVENGREKTLGVFGELHPAVAQRFEISGPVGLFEISLAELLPFSLAEKKYRPVPRYPASIRDIALVVDKGISHGQIMAILKDCPLLVGAELFDVYTGKQVPAGKKSLAYRFTYQSPTHTLTDDEVNKAQEELLAKLEKELGARLRQ